jgi:hypothetical protein
MIKGVHAMFYSPHAEELRTFFKDKMKLPCFDAGEGWPIFVPAQGEVGCHPHETDMQDISFWCDDLQATMADLKSRGVEFTQEVKDQGWGFTTALKGPGDIEIQLYQPKYVRGTPE